MNISSIASTAMSSVIKPIVKADTYNAKVPAMNNDTLQLSSTRTIPIEKISVKDPNLTQKLSEINADPSVRLMSEEQIVGDSITTYDISQYQDLFPYEFLSSKVVAYHTNSFEDHPLFISMQFKNGPSISININPKDSELDESAFKNTVLKVFAICAEEIKQRELLHGSMHALTECGGMLEYDKATKTADLSPLKEHAESEFDMLSFKTYDPEFRKLFPNFYNYDIDPKKVEEARKKFEHYYDEIMKMTD